MLSPGCFSFFPFIANLSDRQLYERFFILQLS